MRDISPKRIVVKIGTNTICREDGTVDTDYLEGVARQVSSLREAGLEIIVVSSGAIGSGMYELGLRERPREVSVKQACAAVGQAILMMEWRAAFRKEGLIVGQVLLTYGAFSDRIRYLNLRKAMEEMFRLGVVPIVNENDVISTDEIEDIFGDNDKLSALVASKADADLLILLTDVDGLYDRNPSVDKDAVLIPTVDEITKDIERMAGGNKNDRSVGGMKTKITAARIAMESGCNMIIANGRTEDIIAKAARGAEVGTLFTARYRYGNRERWIMFAAPKGKISIDDGAEAALKQGRSLLPCGVKEVEGRFKEGDIVRINGFAKGVVNFSSTALAELLEECRAEKAKSHSKVGNDKVVVGHENIVLLQADN
jgi:glutamate 5-kinase